MSQLEVATSFKRFFQPFDQTEEIIEVVGIEDGGWVVLTKLPDSPIRRVYVIDSIGEYVPPRMPTEVIVLQHKGFRDDKEDWKVKSSWGGSTITVTLSRNDKIFVERHPN